MFNRLSVLKENGYAPDTILDIGACYGDWTRSMQQIYSDANYYLFEAIDYDQLKQFEYDSKVKVCIAVLNDKIEYVNWYQKKNTGDSIFREKTYHFKDCEIIRKQTVDIDTIVESSKLFENSKNIFIKIDCQGAEIPILKGAKSILSRTDFILLEVPFFGEYNEGVPSFLEHIIYMNSIGFVPFDIVDNHYINKFNMQIDLLFINKQHSFNKKVNELLV